MHGEPKNDKKIHNKEKAVASCFVLRWFLVVKNAIKNRRKKMAGHAPPPLRFSQRALTWNSPRGFFW
jgi:hypothetical protein